MNSPTTEGTPVALAPLLAALLALTALFLWPGLGGSFVFDDYANIVANPQLDLQDGSWSELRRAARSYGTDGSLGRPLAMLSFALDRSLWGHDPWGYKLVNLLLHLANVLLVFLLLGRLLRAAGSDAASARLAAFFLAGLWALHPLQVSTVFYVVQRMEMLSFSFVLAGLWLYLVARQRMLDGRGGLSLLLGSGLLAAMGLLSKENAVLFPVFALGLELALFRFRAAAPAQAAFLRWGYALGGAAGLLLFAFVAFPQLIADGGYQMRDFTWDQRLLTQLRVLPLYLGWIVLPRPLEFIFYYDNFPHSTGLFQPLSTFLGACLLLGLAALAVALRRRLPLFFLGLFWFFAAHLITSNVAPLELVFEHRNYFAILGVLLAAFALLAALPLQPRAVALIAGVLLLGSAGMSLLRAAAWGAPLHLATELRDRNPGSMRASADLGELYMKLANGDPESRFYRLGMEELLRGAGLAGDSIIPEQGLILLSAAAGQPVDDAWWQSLIDKLSRSAISPQDLGVVVGMVDTRRKGIALDDRRLSEAYTVLTQRLGVPGYQVYNFGDHALKLLGDRELAMALFKEAVNRAGRPGEFAFDHGLHLAEHGYADLGRELVRYAVAQEKLTPQSLDAFEQAIPAAEADAAPDPSDAPTGADESLEPSEGNDPE